MVDIDKILTDAIREVECPELSWQHRIELEIVQRVRAALEHEGIIFTPSRPACRPGQRYALCNDGRRS